MLVFRKYACKRSFSRFCTAKIKVRRLYHLRSLFKSVKAYCGSENKGIQPSASNSSDISGAIGYLLLGPAFSKVWGRVGDRSTRTEGFSLATGESVCSINRFKIDGDAVAVVVRVCWCVGRIICRNATSRIPICLVVSTGTSWISASRAATRLHPTVFRKEFRCSEAHLPFE